MMLTPRPALRGNDVTCARHRAATRAVGNSHRHRHTVLPMPTVRAAFMPMVPAGTPIQSAAYQSSRRHPDCWMTDRRPERRHRTRCQRRSPQNEAPPSVFAGAAVALGDVVAWQVALRQRADRLEAVVVVARGTLVGGTVRSANHVVTGSAGQHEMPDCAVLRTTLFRSAFAGNEV